jgi:hypothetical protein
MGYGDPCGLQHDATFALNPTQKARCDVELQKLFLEAFVHSDIDSFRSKHVRFQTAGNYGGQQTAAGAGLAAMATAMRDGWDGGARVHFEQESSTTRQGLRSDDSPSHPWIN